METKVGGVIVASLLAYSANLIIEQPGGEEEEEGSAVKIRLLLLF